jgi:hypothetical protein
MQGLAYFQATQAAEAKRSALTWLAGRLRWERRLDALRSGRVAATERHAA